MNLPKIHIDRQSDTFLQQRGAMLALIGRLRALESRADGFSSAQHRDSATAAGAI